MNFHELQARIAGDVHRDRLRTLMLATDGSIFQKEPVCVVCPRSTEDVARTVAFAGQHGLSVHPRGAGSGLCGSAIGEGIVIDFTRYMNRLVELDTAAKTFTCEPGYRFGELAVRLRETGLFFPPDPSSGEYATFGGMYGTNASGAHSVKYGNVADYIVDAEVVPGDGTVTTFSAIRETAEENLPEPFQALFRLYRDHQEIIESAYPDTRFNTAGYNLRGLVRENRLDLRRLFAGAEGTLGIVTRLTFRLLDKPAHDSLVVAYMDDIVSSARAVQAILPMGPSGIEVMDKSLLRLAREQEPRLREALPDGVDNILLIEFDAFDPAECVRQADAAAELLRSGGYTGDVHMAVSAQEKAAFWGVRKAAVPILYRLKGEKKILALIEDAAVPTDRLVAYFEGIYRILENHGVEFVIYGHIAKGLLHTRPLLDLKDPGDVDLLRTIADELFELVHGLGGSVSGEHGDGRLRSAYIRRQYPEMYPLFLRTKAALDPEGMFNPEIITRHDPDQMKKSLRFGADYRTREVDRPLLHWSGGMIPEIEKCHGCSKCTTVTSATRMCPVYKATRDEAAAPKAKANLLRALVSGAVEGATLFEAGFQRVMAQCIGCGSCFRECPSGVNIPKMAQEARSRYAERYGVSLRDRLLTSAEQAGRHGGRLSRLVQPVADMPLVRELGERMTGLSARRPVPAFDPVPLRRRVAPKEGKGSPSVLYFAGCYASWIDPSVGEAAVSVLRRMDMTVYTPTQHCCGLPMMTKGMVSPAGKKVRENLAAWGERLRAVDYIAVTCPSCGLALRQEWGDLLNERDVRLAAEKVIHISGLIGRYSDRLRFRSDAAGMGPMAYHLPCHLKAWPEMADSSLDLLSRIVGLDVKDLKANCCGMAGSWGMVAAHDDLSRTIGQDLGGKLAQSGAPVVVTDCPTCRMQMEQLWNRRVVHPVKVIDLLLSQKV